MFKRIPLWAKIASLIITIALCFVVAKVIQKKVKEASWYDKIFPADPPTTESVETGEETDLGEETKGNFSVYLAHSPSQTSEGLYAGYTQSENPSKYGDTLYGFYTDILKPNTQYMVSWYIDSSKLGDLYFPLIDAEKRVIKYSVDFPKEEAAPPNFTDLVPDKEESLFNNSYVFTSGDEGDMFFIAFLTSEYNGSDESVIKANGEILKNAIVLSIGEYEG